MVEPLQITISNAFSSMKIFCMFIQISLKFVPLSSIENASVLFQVKAWHPSNGKPLPEAMMT